jgi:hypothetical protein
VLTADVPDLEVQRVGRGQRNGGDVLADCGYRLKVRMVCREGSLYLLEQRSLAGVVETEQEDGVLCGLWLVTAAGRIEDYLTDLLCWWRAGTRT